MSPLSNPQKREIGKAAHAAWLACPDREALLAINGDMSATAVEKAWRHCEQGKAVGIQSLCACTQAHYGRLLGHFQALSGNTAAADRTRARDADNDRRVARYKLEEALRQRGLSLGYAAAICKTKNKCTLEKATADQIWRLVYTVRSRKKPAKPATPADDNVPW